MPLKLINHSLSQLKPYNCMQKEKKTQNVEADFRIK